MAYLRRYRGGVRRRSNGRRYTPRRTYTARRRYPRRYRRSRYSVRRVAFSPQFGTKLRYAEFNVPLAVTSASPVLIARVANGPAKPNASTTAQPKYWDTLCGPIDGTAPYRSCCCYGAKLIVCITGTNSAPANFWIGARNANDTAPSTVQKAAERPLYRVKQLGYYQGGSNVRYLSMYIPVNKIFGVSKKEILDNEDYWCSYSSVPTNTVAFDIGIEPVASTNSSYYANLKIIFYCRFKDRQNVVDS